MKIKVFPLIFILISLILINLNKNAYALEDIEVKIGTNPFSVYSVKNGILKLVPGDSLWIKVNKHVKIQLISPSGKEVSSKIYNPENNKEPIFLYIFPKVTAEEFGIWKIRIISLKDNEILKEIKIELVNDYFNVENFSVKYKFTNTSLGIFLNSSISKSSYFDRPKYYLALLYPFSFLNNTGSLITALPAGEEFPTTFQRLGYFVINHTKKVEDNKENLKITPMIYNETISSDFSFNFDEFYFEAFYEITFYKILNQTFNPTLSIINLPVFIKNFVSNNFKINKETINLKIDPLNVRTSFFKIKMRLYNVSPAVDVTYKYTLFIHKKSQLNLTSYLVIQLKELNVKEGEIKIEDYISFPYTRILKYFETNSTYILEKLKLALIIEQDKIFNVFIIPLQLNLFLLKIYDIIKNEFLENFEILTNETLLYNWKGNVLGFNSLNDFYIKIKNVTIPKELLTTEDFVIKPYEMKILRTYFYKLNLTVISGNSPIFDYRLILKSSNYTIFNSTINDYRSFFLLPKGIYEIIVIKEGYETYNKVIYLSDSKFIEIRLTKKEERINRLEEDLTLIFSFLIFILIIEILINIYFLVRIFRLNKELRKIY